MPAVAVGTTGRSLYPRGPIGQAKRSDLCLPDSVGALRALLENTQVVATNPHALGGHSATGFFEEWALTTHRAPWGVAQIVTAVEKRGDWCKKVSGPGADLTATRTCAAPKLRVGL